VNRALLALLEPQAKTDALVFLFPVHRVHRGFKDHRDWPVLLAKTVIQVWLVLQEKTDSQDLLDCQALPVYLGPLERMV